MKIAVLGSYGDTVPPEVEAVLGEGVSVAFYKPRIPVFAFSPTEFVIQELSYLETGLRAAADGCDAIAYNSCSDYGIEALRAAVAIPVIGAGETMLTLAANFANRFSIVTVWPVSTNFMPLGQIKARGLDKRLASIRNVSAETIIEGDARPDAFIKGMQSGADGTLQRIIVECEAAIDEDGAELIVIGCTCMSPIADRIAAAVNVPVVNPLTSAIVQAESRLKSNGLPPRKPTARAPSLALITKMVDTVADASVPVDCPVCVSSWE